MALRCARCGNEDPRTFGFLNGKPYCRKCISFNGKKAQPLPERPVEPELRLSFPLSPEQKPISENLISNFIKGKDSLVYAVCGAGKTELSYGVMAAALSRGLQVGFALPRRDVVIELIGRIKEAFPKNRVVGVYGGHEEELSGDIIVLTTHQLYRYERYFDLLVMDEIDAFPFKGNETLVSFYRQSVRGHVVLLTATPSEEVLREFSAPGHEILELRTRFHRHPMPVPRIIVIPSPFKGFYVAKKLREWKKQGKPALVFTPSKAGAERLAAFLRPFFRNGSYVHSEDPGRERKISLFKRRKLDYLVTTSVLERGVTVEGLNLIVADADEEWVYGSSTLIQIAGRVGRKMRSPDGEVLFLAERETDAMKDAIREIRKNNEFLLKLPR